MKTIEQLFDRMDTWRHFPAYQLERRADLYFALYLPEVLEKHLGIGINQMVVPEFPVRIGTVYEDKNEDDKSCKIDYMALSKDGRTAILVELKTELKSRRTKQDDFMAAAAKKDFEELLKGLKKIFRTTTFKRKYCHMLKYLQEMGLIRIPERMRGIMSRPYLQGITKASRDIVVTSQVRKTIIVYIQPKKDEKKDNDLNGTRYIYFDEFGKIVRSNEDPISQRFAASLLEWAGLEAGA